MSAAALTKISETTQAGDRSFNPRGTPQQRVVHFKYTFSSSYPTGGDTLSLASYFTTVSGVVVPPSQLYNFVWTGNKLLAYVMTTGAQVASATDLSGITVPVIAFGVV